MELANRFVDAIDTRVVIDRERLVVGKAEVRIDKVRIKIDRLREIEDVLIKERHLDVGMSVVEIDRGLKIAAGHRDTGARSKVFRDVALEIVKQHKEFAVSRRESEARGIEVDDRGTSSGERSYRRFESVEHRLRRGGEGIETVSTGA